ncbi:MAG: hypothetical protein LUC43_03530 [Burkholderiales bacterium]|nr:hypothetical protein [Burkholderiales bacterium]
MNFFCYPCKFKEMKQGLTLITCRDLPEIRNKVDTFYTNKECAQFAIEEALDIRISRGQYIPRASKPHPDETCIVLSEQWEEKIIRHNNRKGLVVI